MKLLRLAAIALLMLVPAVASAQVSGTTGTEKRFQDQAVRIGVITQKNNTGTASTGAVTMNGAGSGVVTSEALTTNAGSNYTLTLTNDLIAATDIVLASVWLGTSTQGEPLVESITPAAGSVVIIVRNNHGSQAFNGTIKIGFVVVRQTATGAN